MRNIPAASIIAASLASCGGGGGGAPADIDPGSPGGIWFGRDSAGQTVSIYIAENGDLLATLNTDGTAFPTFGSGSVAVTVGSVVNGSFELRGSILPPVIQPQEDFGCTLAGTVAERQSLSVDIICSDSNGVVYNEALRLSYDPAYARRSSIDAIAGNYTLEFRPATNLLTIAADGTLFGSFDNGANCLVNGSASIIDENYTFIDITWTMTSCVDLFGSFEGVEMSGLALANPLTIGDPDAYLFLLTGRTQDGIATISVIYEPR